MADTELQVLITALKGMKSGAAFSPYIDYIVFPKYRRISQGQRINFGFPLTVLVGRNGSGKSSILHALAGAPEGRSVGRFWFGTKVDPIDDPAMGGGGKQKLDESQRARFWYGYKHGGNEKQAIKQRVRNVGDPDYWEPTRFAKRYGMTIEPPNGEDRHAQIQMPSEYLSLRLYLSAFDKCFHFASTQTLNSFESSPAWVGAVKAAEERKQKGPKKKQRSGVRKTAQARDYIRHRSKGLEQAFASEAGYARGKNRMADPPEKLSTELLAVVSEIVGKQYTEGWLIRHRFYESWGESVRFATSAGKYTEANAGSGETAVVKIVRLFERAQNHSLLLLDEPETSLHPGAQAQLLKYMLRQIKQKKLQVVISTHAPAFVRHLPREAIKVLQSTPDGFVNVVEDVTWEDAFHEIGQEFDPNCNIVVEDRLAKAILDAVAATRGTAFAAKVRVRFGPGGDTAMKRDAAVYVKEPAKAPIMVFDGDKQTAHQNPEKLTQDQMTPKALDEIIKGQVGVGISFAEDSNMPSDRKIALRIAYLNYFQKKVFYLPFRSPDEALWSDDAARAHLAATLAAAKVNFVMKELAGIGDFKKKFAKLADALGGVDLHLASLHSMFVKRFVEQNDPLCSDIVGLLNKALAASEPSNG